MPLIHPAKFGFVSLTHPSSVLSNSNIIKDKIPVLGLDIVERQVMDISKKFQILHE